MARPSPRPLGAAAPSGIESFRRRQTLSRLGGSRPSDTIIAFGALAILTCALFLPALQPGAVFYFRDISQNHHPYRELTVSMLEAHQTPLWNPARGAGQPFLANPNALVLHPTTLLFLVFSVATAMKLSVILQILLAAVASWLLLRDAGVSRAGSLLGAGLFAFSGYMISLGNLLNLLDSAAFMPLTLWLAARAVKHGFAPWGSLAALSLAVQIAAGEPAILFCTGLAFIGLHWSFPGPPGQPSRAIGPRLAVVSGLVLLAATLAMVQVLPTLELLGQSERGAGFDRDEAMKWSLPPAALVETAIPNWFGDPTSADIARFRGGTLFDAGLPFILSIFLGPAGLLLAGIGISDGVRSKDTTRRLEALVLSLLCLGGLLLSMGRFFPLYPTLLSLVPPMQWVRYPVKYFLLVAWVVAILSARGYDACADRRGRAAGSEGRRRAAKAIALAGLAVLVVVMLMQLGDPVMRAGLSIVRSLSVVVIAGSLVSLGGTRVQRFGLALLPLLDLVAAGRHLNPVAPASLYSEAPALGGALGGAGGGRLASLPRPKGFAFRTPAGTDLRPDSLAGGFRWDRMTLRNATYFSTGYRFAYDRGNERLDVMPGAALGRMIYEGAGSMVSTSQVSRLLSVAGVDRLITYGGLTGAGLTEAGRLEGESNVPVVVMRVETALPRAYVVRHVEVHADIIRAAKRLREESFDPQSTVILESGQAPVGSAGSDSASDTARITKDEPALVTVEVAASGAGYLVLTDTFYPGWIAEVDGVSSPIIRANTMFRAVAVPAGDHVVAFRYRPSSVRSGLMVTAAGLLLSGLLAIPRRR